jgi:hypothetical protein
MVGPPVRASASRLRFCSITDANYLAQVLVMHRSLREVLPDARDEVLCMDSRSRRVLEEIALPGLEPIGIEELEERDAELAAVRHGRSRHEYAQTAKPALCLDLVRRHQDADWITYVDADSMFFSGPAPIFEELGGHSVGIVGHRFSERFRSRARWASPYCPSWVSFAPDRNGEEVAGWWRGQCLEWCFHRVEGDRHSDQGYLRDWPERFDGVHVLQHPGIGPAPWTDNSTLQRAEGGVEIAGGPLILFHYQSLRLHAPRWFDYGRELPGSPVPLSWRIYRGYRLSSAERDLVWKPYLVRLGEAMSELHRLDPTLVDELKAPGPREMARAARKHVWMRRHDLAEALRRTGPDSEGDRVLSPK